MERNGIVVWITGLSAAGKTTLAKSILSRLPGNGILLDGDELRDTFQEIKTGYDIDTRQSLAMTYARLARMLAGQRFIVIVAAVALFHNVHAWNRLHQPNYIEVFLDVPENILQSRDPKGFYKKAQKGELTNFTGVDIKPEMPIRPDIHIDYNTCNDLDEMTTIILDAIDRHLSC